MTRGARPCRFSSFRSRRLAARFARRRAWARRRAAPDRDRPGAAGPGRGPRPPQPVLLAGDPDLDLVQVPLIAGTGQPPADLVREALAELEAPLPHGLGADVDAAGGQQLLDHPQAEREAEVEPDRVADDLRREPVAGVGGRDRLRHARPVANLPAARNLARANLTVPDQEPSR